MEPVGGRIRYVPSVCQMGVAVGGSKRQASVPLLRLESGPCNIVQSQGTLRKSSFKSRTSPHHTLPTHQRLEVDSCALAVKEAFGSPVSGSRLFPSLALMWNGQKRFHDGSRMSCFYFRIFRGTASSSYVDVFV